MGESLYCAASRTAAGHLSFDQHSSALTISRAAALSVSTRIATQLARRGSWGGMAGLWRRAGGQRFADRLGLPVGPAPDGLHS